MNSWAEIIELLPGIIYASNVFYKFAIPTTSVWLIPPKTNTNILGLDTKSLASFTPLDIAAAPFFFSFLFLSS